jgi:hypothetical protein
MVCPPATSKAGARWPICGLVVVATTSCRNNKVQMIRLIKWALVVQWIFSLVHLLIARWQHCFAPKWDVQLWGFGSLF